MHTFKDRAGPEAINVDLRGLHFSDLPFRRTWIRIAAAARFNFSVYIDWSDRDFGRRHASSCWRGNPACARK
jgi:hypothetical protein